MGACMQRFIGPDASSALVLRSDSCYNEMHWWELAYWRIQQREIPPGALEDGVTGVFLMCHPFYFSAYAPSVLRNYCCVVP